MPSLPGGGGPADHRRQGPRDRADGRVQGRPGLQRRVDEDVEHEGRRRHRRGDGVDAEGQDGRCPARRGPPPKTAASAGARRPLGRGRPAVRLIRASRDRSRYWFQALAPPATSPVPRSVSRSVDGSLLPRAPSQKPDGHRHQDHARRSAAWSARRYAASFPPAAARATAARGSARTGLIERDRRLQATASQVRGAVRRLAPLAASGQSRRNARSVRTTAEPSRSAPLAWCAVRTRACGVVTNRARPSNGRRSHQAATPGAPGA